MSKPGRGDDPAKLRRQAEAILHNLEGESREAGPTSDPSRLLHELKVHQIELELQNAELRQARNEIEDVLQRYTELYEFAPVAYLTLDEGNMLRQLNLAGAALLGAERSQLIGRAFSQCVAPADRPKFSDFAAKTHARAARETCELELQRSGAGSVACHVRVEAVAVASGDGLRLAVLDITEQKALREAVWRQANYDSLTQLPNRNLFFDRLHHEIEMTRREGQILALLFIDLDRFKEVNDAFGHAIGDRLLCLAAARIAECVRATDTVARLGGDEFTIVLSALADTDRVGIVAGKLLDALARPFIVDDASLQLSASIGITLYPIDAQDVSELVRNADQAMYLAKAGGRNRFSYFTPSLQLAAQARLDLVRDLRVALTGRQFELYFQPIVELATGKLVKAEALLRWQHPERGVISAADFVDATEDVGLVGPLGDWVFAEATHWARRWREEAGHAIQVSVNVSATQFTLSGSAARWVRVIRDLAVDPGQIGIDVSEDVLFDDSPVVLEELRALNEAGIAIAINGFGAGRSALSSLTRFGVGTVKLSRKLVEKLGVDSKAGSLAEAIITAAHKLGIQVVAEGIETVAQRDKLLAYGCDFGQGFLFAPALPPETFWARGSARFTGGSSSWVAEGA